MTALLTEYGSPAVADRVLVRCLAIRTYSGQTGHLATQRPCLPVSTLRLRPAFLPVQGHHLAGRFVRPVLLVLND